MEIAELEEEIAALPEGICTQLEMGRKLLSSGLRQKLMIARAVVKRQPYFLLDEGTRSLDRQTQQKIIRNLAVIPATKVIIAQRLATVRYCTKVIVLDRGRCIGQCTWLVLGIMHKRHPSQ